MRRLLTVLILLTASVAVASRTEYLSVVRKFQAMDKAQYRPGTSVSLSSGELNSYVQTELETIAPVGVRNPKVELIGGNQATGRALIDFVKLRSAQGKPPNFFIRTLLEGEHEVAVTTRIRSGGGTATVDLQRVEVAGIPIEGRALDYVIQNYLLPKYPDVKIGQPFQLPARVDRIEVTPGAAHVVMR